MKYAEESLDEVPTDDRGPIYVRRPEATGALLMHRADSFAAEAAADMYKCPQSRH